jgi:hypothetical protein
MSLLDLQRLLYEYDLVDGFYLCTRDKQQHRGAADALRPPGRRRQVATAGCGGPRRTGSTRSVSKGGLEGSPGRFLFQIFCPVTLGVRLPPPLLCQQLFFFVWPGRDPSRKNFHFSLIEFCAHGKCS